MLATIIDVDALWQAIWTAAVAGIGVTLIYSLAVLGSTRSLDMRRAGRGVASAAYAILALLGGGGTIAAIIYSLVLITKK